MPGQATKENRFRLTARRKRLTWWCCQEILTAETMDSYANFPLTLIEGARLPK